MTPRYLAALGAPDGFGSWLRAGRSRAASRSGRCGSPRGAGDPAVSAQSRASCSCCRAWRCWRSTRSARRRWLLLALKQKNGSQRSQLWPAPLALGAVLAGGAGGAPEELLVACGVLVLGAVLLLRAPRRRREAPPAGCSRANAGSVTTACWSTPIATWTRATFTDGRRRPRSSGRGPRVSALWSCIGVGGSRRGRARSRWRDRPRRRARDRRRASRTTRRERTPELEAALERAAR